MDGIEQLFEIVLDHLRVRTKRKDLQQIRVRTEVEPGENATLLFQIILKPFLAEIQLFLHTAKRVQQNVILTALDHVFLFGCALHNLFPLVVHISECL